MVFAPAMVAYLMLVWRTAWKVKKQCIVSLGQLLGQFPVNRQAYSLFFLGEGLNLTDLKLFVRSVLDQEPWKYDSKVIPLPWRESEENDITEKIRNGGLNVAVYFSDGNVFILYCVHFT
jgi:hypothetical protein